jgi:hypothetical protein
MARHRVASQPPHPPSPGSGRATQVDIASKSVRSAQGQLVQQPHSKLLPLLLTPGLVVLVLGGRSWPPTPALVPSPAGPCIALPAPPGACAPGACPFAAPAPASVPPAAPPPAAPPAPPPAPPPVCASANVEPRAMNNANAFVGSFMLLVLRSKETRPILRRRVRSSAERVVLFGLESWALERSIGKCVTGEDDAIGLACHLVAASASQVARSAGWVALACSVSGFSQKFPGTIDRRKASLERVTRRSPVHHLLRHLPSPAAGSATAYAKRSPAAAAIEPSGRTLAGYRHRALSKSKNLWNDQSELRHRAG